MERMKVWSIIACLICFGMGFLIVQALYQPKVIRDTITITRTIYETITETVTEPVYIEVPVDREVEVIKYQNIYARDFKSVKQFVDWYEAQDFRLMFPSGSHLVDCEDYARHVQKTALRQGYSISEALTWNRRYYNVQVTDIWDGHDGCMVWIDGTYYWFEPNPEHFEIRKIVGAD